VVSADDFFMTSKGEYNFNPKSLAVAHFNCQERVEAHMRTDAPRIAVANTFAREWEMESYFKLAEAYGYAVFSLIVETRHAGKNEHDVPESTVQRMRDRFQVKL